MATGKSMNDMIARIVGELGQRTDLASGGSNPTVIPNAIADAIQIYQKSRFRFNENLPLTPFTFMTVASQPYYDVSTVPNIKLLYKIDYLNYLLGNTTQKMERLMPEDIYLALLQGSTAGPPEEWAWDGQSIIMYPNPNIPYLITVGGYMAYPAPTDPVNDTTNPWMNDAERLIRSRAKYEIALHFTRNDKMVAAMSPDDGSGGASERYFNELLGEFNKIRGTSRIRAMRF
jgi:hypothetical protein